MQQKDKISETWSQRQETGQVCYKTLQKPGKWVPNPETICWFPKRAKEQILNASNENNWEIPEIVHNLRKELSSPETDPLKFDEAHPY